MEERVVADGSNAADGVVERGIEGINTMSSKLAVGGWMAGFAYAAWISSSGLPASVGSIGLVYGAILVVGGLFISSLLIGMPLAMLAAAGTKAYSGRATGGMTLYVVAMLITPVATFSTGKWATYHLADYNPFGFTRAQASVAPNLVECSDPKMTFTLGPNDSPSVKEKAALCQCLKANLPPGDKQAIANDSVSEDVLARFAATLTNSCGVSMR